MRLVPNRTQNGVVEHPIYTPDEAKAANLDPIWENWRENGVQKGDWVVTEDGFVVQVLATGHLNNGQRWIRTCTGTFRVLRTERLTTEERENRFTFDGKNIRGLHVKVTKGVERFGKLVAAGMQPVDAHQAAFPRSSRRNSERYAKVLLERKEVREVVARELADIMDGMGLTEEFILSQLREIATTDGTNALNARVSAIKELISLRGMAPKKVSTSVTAKFQGIPANRLQEAQQAIAAPIATQLGEIPMPQLEVPSEFIELEATVTHESDHQDDTLEAVGAEDDA